METVTKRLYEAMFLVDSAQAAGDWDGTKGAIETVLQRADAEVVTLRKWSERRLAYDVGKSSRGTYLLSYFKANSQAIAGLEKDVRLSEKILRVLVLSAEDRPEGFNDKDMAEPVETPAESDAPAVAEAPKTEAPAVAPAAEAPVTEAPAADAPAEAKGGEEKAAE